MLKNMLIKLTNRPGVLGNYVPVKYHYLYKRQIRFPPVTLRVCSPAARNYQHDQATIKWNRQIGIKWLCQFTLGSSHLTFRKVLKHYCIQRSKKKINKKERKKLSEPKQGQNKDFEKSFWSKILGMF